MSEREDRTLTRVPGRGSGNALPPGFVLGSSYTVVSELGEGGFGITYLAEHTILQGKLVAIKEYLPRDAAYRDVDSSVRMISESYKDVYEWGRTRFLEEANHLYRISAKGKPCPNIVGVHDVFEANNTAYMVMDYIEGRSLRAAIEANEEFDESRLRSILFPLLDALDEIHAQGLIHRDITPSNIILSKQDESPILIDFGSARADVSRQTAQRDAGDAGATMTQVVTPGYSPLEQHEGTRQDGRTDIYSLAATLYYAAFKTKAVDAPLRQGAVRETHRDPMEPAAAKGAGRYSPAFLKALDKGLALYQKGRPNSAAAWRRQFGNPPPAKEAATRGNRRVVVSLALLLIAAVGVGAFQLSRIWERPLDETLEEARNVLSIDPLDRNNVSEALRLFSEVRSNNPQEPAARAGSAGCDALLDLIDSLEKGSLDIAVARLDSVTGALREARIGPPVLQRIRGAVDTATAVAEAGSQIQRVALDGKAIEALSRVVEAATRTSQDDPRVRAALQALAALGAAADAVGEERFGDAQRHVGRAERHVADLGFGASELSIARAAIRDGRKRTVASLNRAGLGALRAGALSEQGLGSARAAFERARAMDAGDTVADAGTALVDALESLRDRIESGQLDSLALLSIEVRERAFRLEFSEQWIRKVETAVERARFDRSLADVERELSGSPVSAASLGRVEEMLGSLLEHAREQGLDSSLVGMASIRLSMVQELLRALELAGNLEFSAARSTIEGLRPTAHEAKLAPAVVDGTLGVVEALEAQRIAALLAQARQTLAAGRGPEVLTRARQAYEAALAIRSGDERASKGLSLVASLRTLGAAQRRRELDAAWEALAESEGLMDELGWDEVVRDAIRESLKEPTRQQVERLLARTMDAVRIAPFSRHSLDLGGSLVGRALALSRLAHDEAPESRAAAARQLLEYLGKASTALEDERFAEAGSELDEAAEALEVLGPAAELVLEAARSLLEQGRSGACTAWVAEVAAAVERAQRALSAGPLSRDALGAAAKALGLSAASRAAASNAGCDSSALERSKAVTSKLERAELHLREDRYEEALRALQLESAPLASDSKWLPVLERAEQEIGAQRRQAVEAARGRGLGPLLALPLDRDTLTRSRRALEQADALAAGGDPQIATGLALVEILVRARDALDEHGAQSGAGRALEIIRGAGDSFSGSDWARQVLAQAAARLEVDVQTALAAALDSLRARPLSGDALNAAARFLDEAHELAAQRSLAEAEDAATRAKNAVDLLIGARNAIDATRFDAAATALQEANARLAGFPIGAAEMRQALGDAIANLRTERRAKAPKSRQYVPLLAEALGHLSRNPRGPGVLDDAQAIVQSVLDTLQADLPQALGLADATRALREASRACEQADARAALAAWERARRILMQLGIEAGFLDGAACR